MSTRRAFVRALGLAVPAAWLPEDLSAQPVTDPLKPYTVRRADFPPQTIRADLQSYRLRLQIADNSIQDYVRASFNIIAQGHREGFQHFRTWYRTKDAQRQAAAATNQMMAAFFGFALKQGLNVIFPGSGEFVKKLKEAATWAYDQAASRLGRVPSGDVNRFLDAHQAGIEQLISSWLVKAEEVRNQNPALWTAAKNEFIFEQIDAAQPTSQLGPQTRQLLEELGVPPPDDSTLLRFKAQIMAGQIAEALWAWDWDRMSGSRWEVRNVALSETAQYFWPQDPGIFCAPQVRVRDFFRTPICRTTIREGNLAGSPP
jgi:hypothetical protein